MTMPLRTNFLLCHRGYNIFRLRILSLSTLILQLTRAWPVDSRGGTNSSLMGWSLKARGSLRGPRLALWLQHERVGEQGVVVASNGILVVSDNKNTPWWGCCVFAGRPRAASAGMGSVVAVVQCHVRVCAAGPAAGPEAARGR